MHNELYSFLCRGLLAEEALDAAGRPHRALGPALDAETAARLSLDLFDEEMVRRAKKMAAVYTAIAVFENSVRLFVSRRLLEEFGEGWWDTCVSEKVRSKAKSRQQEEAKVRWHTRRGDALINYTEFGDLASIISQNWTKFEDYMQSQEWARHVIETLERSRNVIMHSGELENEDVERIGVAIRDWIKQVGA